MTAAVADIAYIKSEINRYASDYEGTFAPQCLRILDKGKRLIPLALNPVQRAIGAVERQQLEATGNARIYVLKGRQGGITTDQQGRALHLIWSGPGAVAATLSDKREKTDKIFEITRRFIENFPPELLPRVGTRETREISFPFLDSHFYTETAGAARSIAGLTLSRLHCSEFAHYEDPRTVIKVSTPSMIPVGSVITLETTASAYGSDAHAYWQESEKGVTGYRAMFFPWWKCDEVHYADALLEPDELGALEEDEADLVARAGLTLEQIKWRRRLMREMGRPEFLQEYAEDPESCWMASGSMFFEAKILKALRLRAQEREPLRIETLAGGTLEIYSDLAEGERAILGVDTAEGVGGDASTYTARAFPSWRLVSVFRSSRVEPKEFASIINTWGRAYRLALLVVEKNSHGITVLRHLRDDHKYPVARIYHRQTLDDESAHEGEQGRIGWVTSAESKPLLLDAGRELFNAVIARHAEVPSLTAVTEAFSVHRGKDNKIDLNGKDVLVSEMLAWIGRGVPVREVWVA